MPELQLRTEFANIMGAYPYDEQETSLGLGIWRVLKPAMGEALTAETFDPAQTLARLKITLRMRMKQIIAHAIEHEQEQWLKSQKYPDWNPERATHPILTSLHAESPTAIPEIDSITIGEPYYAALDQHLEESMGSFDILQKIRSDPQMRDHILPFIREVAEHLKDAEQRGIDDVFWHVRNEVATNEHLAIAPERFSLLYILVYLPWELRYAVQQSLMNRSIGVHLTNHAQDEESAEGHEFHRLVGQYYRLKIQLHHHWEKLIEQFGASDAVFTALSEDRIALMKTLTDIEAFTGTHNLLAHFEAHNDFLCTLFSGIEEMDDKSDCSTWQQTDIGHGFDFHTWEIDSIQRRKEKAELLTKDSGFACIFEDDPAQMEHYRQMVECSRYSINPDAQAYSSKAEDILAQAENTAVQLFLIDIEQEHDPEAGIRLGEAVLRRRAEQLAALGKKLFKDHEQTRITIWIRSRERMQQAHAHFLRLKEELNTQYKGTMPNNMIFGLGGGYSGTPIICEVQMKNIKPF
jgi:hypothetical protein